MQSPLRYKPEKHDIGGRLPLRLRPDRPLLTNKTRIGFAGRPSPIVRCALAISHPLTQQSIWFGAGVLASGPTLALTFYLKAGYDPLVMSTCEQNERIELVLRHS